MTSPTENQVEQTKQNDKELNFRKLEEKYQRELAHERAARQDLEVRMAANANVVEDEEDDEPYVDKKRLQKTLAKHGQSTQTEIQKAMEKAKQSAKEELKQEMWLEQNPDFYDTLQHAEKFAQAAPKLAESILRMPEGFERQKLVYENIKTLGINKPKAPEQSIQQKVDANRRSPYYQPSGVGTAPYASVGDFSSGGQKQAYEKMQQLKNSLRL